MGRVNFNLLAHLDLLTKSKGPTYIKSQPHTKMHILLLKFSK